MYVSPAGTAGGSGTIDSPVDLDTAQALVAAGGTIKLLDGIYDRNAFVLGTGTPITIEADAGARPVLVGVDGYPPQVFMAPNVTVRGLWFGGTKFSDENGRIITLGSGCTIQGNTFWGYSQNLTPGSSIGNIYQANRFVRCGYGVYWHDLYIASGQADYSQVIGNIHVGGAGYKIHLYHSPQFVTVHNNFMAGSSISDLAVQESNHTLTRNILWGECAVSYWNAINCAFNANIFGPTRIPFTDVSADNSAADNVFCNGQQPFGDSPQVWDAAAIETNLGKSIAEIDGAIAALITKFQQTIQQIHDDATIEDDFAVLSDVLVAWAASQVI